MTISESQAVKPSRLLSLKPYSSIIIPGSGQFLTDHRGRGFVIFTAAAIMTFLIHWSLTQDQFGQVTIANINTSWLLLPLALFWIWNIIDSISLSVGKMTSVLIGLVLAMVILYSIAYDSTDVRLERLVTRFNDARTVATSVLNPDLFSIYINGEPQICSWGCLWDNLVINKIEGKPAGVISMSKNLGDIIGKFESNPFLGSGTGLQFVPGKMIDTIAIGLLATIFSTIFAAPISFLAAHNIMTRIRGGNVIYYFMRAFFNIIRSIDTLVWGLIVIVWVGLGSFAGVIALTIHSVATLGKLFSEEIEHIDPGPVEALTSTGANLFQIIRYAVIPQVIPPFLAYTLLRWDINMRSATIVGIVAGGGIGFFVVETIRMGGYQQYGAALWIVAIVIILVDYISARSRERILKDQPAEKKPRFGKMSVIFRWISIVVGLAVFVYLWNVSGINFRDIFNPGRTFGRLVSDFLTIDLSSVVLNEVIKQMINTILQALLATTLGAIIAIPFSFLAAKNLIGKNRFFFWMYYISRSAFNILRSIEALLYVAIFVFWVGIGRFAGMMALSVTTFALIGKLFSEAIENIETGPIEAITATGANRLQMIMYAVLPQIVPPFASYLIYQWDINIRMATIIGLAGGGGIGMTLWTYYGGMQYHKAGTVIAAIVIVVTLMDLASAKIRQKLV